MIDRQESRRSEPGQLSVFPTARQAPVHFERIELLIWLYMSSQLGEVISGPELLKIGWDNKGRDGERLNWNHPDPIIRGRHRHLVIGAFNKIRRSVHADGEYVIDTAYAKRDGASGWRLREITDGDLEQLKNDGYHGAYHRARARLAERAAIAAESRRPALAAGQEQDLPADEPDEPIAEGAAEESSEQPTLPGSISYDQPLPGMRGLIDAERELATASPSRHHVDTVMVT